MLPGVLVSKSVHDAAAASDAIRVDSDAYGGFGVFAKRPLAAGTELFTEYPLLAIQHRANRKLGVKHVCANCYRFLGPLEAQVGELLTAKRCSTVALLPEKLPSAGEPALPTPVPCPAASLRPDLGCDLQFCSAECAGKNFSQQHRLLCPCVRLGTTPSDMARLSTESAAAGIAASKRARDDEEREDVEECLDGLCLSNPSKSKAQEQQQAVDVSDVASATTTASASGGDGGS